VDRGGYSKTVVCGRPAHRRREGQRAYASTHRWRRGRSRAEMAAARTVREAGPGGGAREKRTQLWSRGSLQHPQEKGLEGRIWVPVTPQVFNYRH
jgi:hypothetical protein